MGSYVGQVPLCAAVAWRILLTNLSHEESR